MAYQAQQPRFANANNYHEASRSAPSETQQGYQEGGYGGQAQQQQQQDYSYNNGRSQGYDRDGRQPSSRQQYKQEYPRNGQGYPSQGHPQQNLPGPSAGRGQMRGQTGGGHDQQSANNGSYQQNQSIRQVGYSNSHQGENQYQDQYKDEYDLGQYGDGYGYEQNAHSQFQRQPQKAVMNRGQTGSRQEYTHGSHDQRPSNGQGRPNKSLPPIMGPPQERQRMIPDGLDSPDTLSWDNPFPTFPAHEKRRPEEQRPSTATGQYHEQTFSSQGRGPQPIHDNYSAPNLPNDHQGAYHNGSRTMSPQPSHIQAPQRSNTMPVDLAQGMSNLNIQPRFDSNPQSRRESPPQHLNFSQPRRPSAGNQNGLISQTRQGNGCEDVLDSYAENLDPPNTMHSIPFESPGHEEMPNFGVPSGHDIRTAPQAAPYDDRRGRDRTRELQGQEYRSRSQPAAREQHEPNQMDDPLPAMDPRYAQSRQNAVPQNPAELQQSYDQQNWQNSEQNLFGPPARARTDNFGPGQPIARNASDPYRGVPSGHVELNPSIQPRGSASSQPGYPGPRSMTPGNGQTSPAESVNRPRPGMVSANNSYTITNGNARRGSKPDSLTGHPAPVRPGLIGHSQSAPTNQAGLAARPPPVRNYNGHSGSGPAPQTSPPPQSHQQYQAPPQPRIQSHPQQPPQIQQQQPQQAIPIDDGPVTYESLQRIRTQIQQNPSDQALQLHLAKKMLEAAATLADDGGRADPKTKNKNREKYTVEANKLVKKLVGYNYTEAMFYMAECYGSGTLGLAKDPSQAFILYQSAAKLNHAGAAYRVAVCCELGSDEGGGTRRDPLKAFQWYQRAATLGDVPAMYKTGVIQLKGLLGQPQNPQEAVTWLTKAAEHADSENPHSLHELALLYMNTGPNIGIPRDEAYAAQLLCQAADLGYKFSQYRLGFAYEYGQLGFPIDARQSITWYSKAAVQEEHQSELALSGWYLTGAENIMAQNDAEAYLWARKAANASLAKAEYAMGFFTEVGVGCPADIEGAKRWYWKAASQNFPKARDRLEELRRGGPKMNRARISRSVMHRAQGDCKVM